MTAIRVSNVYKIFGPTMTHARVIDMLTARRVEGGRAAQTTAVTSASTTST